VKTCDEVWHVGIVPLFRHTYVRLHCKVQRAEVEARRAERGNRICTKVSASVNEPCFTPFSSYGSAVEPVCSQAQLCMWRWWLVTTTFESGGDKSPSSHTKLRLWTHGFDSAAITTKWREARLVYACRNFRTNPVPSLCSSGFNFGSLDLAMQTNISVTE